MPAEPIATLYHYTTPTKLEAMETPRNVTYRDFRTGEEREVHNFCGLAPLNPPVRGKDSYLSGFADLPAVFGLMEPDAWLHEEGIWGRVAKKLVISGQGERVSELVLLEAILTDSDEVHIGDSAYLFSGSNPKDAIAKYCNSIVPFEKYDGTATLPELIVFNPVSMKRVRQVATIERDELEAWGVKF